MYVKKFPQYVYSIPDAYWNSASNGSFPSHESVCVLNLYSVSAHIGITLFFEDRPKMEGFGCVVEGERCAHIRMDRLIASDGTRVPQDTPYAIVLTSNIPLSVQYTRMDTSQPEMALMTAMVRAGGRE